MSQPFEPTNHASNPTAKTPESVTRPSKALMRALVSGLVGLSGACDDTASNTEDKDPDKETHEHDALSCNAVADKGAADAGGKASSHNADGGVVSSGSSATSDEAEKELSTTDIQLTYAELTKMCNERNGYVQTHGSCSGVNTCAGFTYGDWDEEAQLIEHTCSGVNGCAGLSCVTTAKPATKGDMTGEEIMKLDDAWYEERAGNYGPKACRTCHISSEFDEKLKDYVYDYTKLKIPVWGKSGRNGDNWLQRSAAHQEAIIAFGVRGITDDGVAYSNMASYAKLFSKEEIKRVVAYMRDFDAKAITFKEIKLHPGKAE